MTVKGYHSWDSDELKEIIRKLYGPEYANESEVYIKSFWKKAFAAWLNRDEAIGLIDNLIPETYSEVIENDYIRALDYHFKAFNDKNIFKELNYTKDHIETHIIAYAHSLYSMSDVLGQIIVSSYHLRNDINAGEITLTKVAELLQSRPNSRKILRRINKLFNLRSFQYLKGFVNTHKHVYHIEIPYSFLCIVEGEETSHGMKINGFKREDKVFREKWAKSFLKDDMIEIFNVYHGIGCQINNDLSPRCAFLI